jgi:hypothetical protein
MSEHEMHEVAMCAARTFADMVVRTTTDSMADIPSPHDFGEWVADAYIASQARFSLTPEERQNEALKALDGRKAAG